MRWWTIYALLDPVSNEVRYVGYTRRTIADRLKYHVWDSTRAGPHGKTKKAKWLRGLARDKRVPGIAVLQVGRGDWSTAEQFWVAAFRQAGMDLLNMTAGGTGVRTKER